MIGTGMIGGKACGMLLSRAIVRNLAWDINEVLEPHDSFFIGSDVYYTYIVDNGFWDIRVRQREETEYFFSGRRICQTSEKWCIFRGNEKSFFTYSGILWTGSFLLCVPAVFWRMASETHLQENMNLFFCANRGSLEERLAEFENAIKTVYASSMSLSALDYRKRRGLDKRDEQMALLVQRVSGSYYGSYYMPCAAGVGYSYSPYKFLEKIDPKAGMLRLVMGLGTSAVDRTEGSYPRLVSLDMPQATNCTTIAQKHQFSQRKIEVVDTTRHCLRQLELDQIEAYIPGYLGKLLLEHDFEVEASMRERGINREVRFISCGGLVKKELLMQQIQMIMQLIQKEYDYPVDIEFTVNLSETGEYSINLLQCRPLQVFKDTGNVEIPDNIPKKILFWKMYILPWGYRGRRR